MPATLGGASYAGFSETALRIARWTILGRVDLSFTPEDEAYRSKVRDWFARTRPGRLETHEQRRAWHRKLYDAGFIGMGWPKEYGGQDSRPREPATRGGGDGCPHEPGRGTRPR